MATALHAFVHDNLAACLYPLWHAVGMMSMTHIFRPVMIAAATAAALTVVAPSTDAAAQTQATGARELLLLCQARAEQPELDLAQCSAYLRGFLDRVLQDQVNGREPEFCPPRARVSAQTAASALTRLAFREPAALDEPAPVFLSLALQRAFPCEMPNFGEPVADGIQPANPVSMNPMPVSPAPAAAQAPQMQPQPQVSAAPAAAPAAPGTQRMKAPGGVRMNEMAAAPQQGQAPASAGPIQKALDAAQVSSLPPSRPAVGAPGSVGPVRNAPGNRIPTDRGHFVSTQDGMRVAIPPGRADVHAVPLESAPPSTSRASVAKYGELNHTPAAQAARASQAPTPLYGPVGTQ